MINNYTSAQALRIHFCGNCGFRFIRCTTSEYFNFGSIIYYQCCCGRPFINRHQEYSTLHFSLDADIRAVAVALRKEMAERGLLGLLDTIKIKETWSC